MAEHGVNGLMAETMEKIRSMVDVNTIIGDPIVTHDGTTLIPISKVTFGFGSAGSDFKPRNSSDSAPLCFGGGGGAGEDVLLVGEAGVPQVDVHVHQSRADHQPGGIDDLVGLDIQAPFQQRYLAVFHQQILDQDRVGDRVDHPSVFDEKFHGIKFLRIVEAQSRF